MYMLDVTLLATIRKLIHLVHMKIRDNVVCKDRTLADTDYSYSCQVAYCLKEEKHFHGQRSTYPFKLEKIAKNNQFI